MVEKRQDGSLVVKGRVDSNNAQAFEEELMGQVTPGEDLHMDASDLDYVSSAGLRVFLKVKKAIKAELFVENVSNEVYDIFEVTGFTELLKVKKRLREISVEGCEVVGEGANGKVYRIDDETIIKVFAPGVPLETVQEERDIARAAFVSGVPTAISYDVARVGESYGAVYEMLNATTLSAYVAGHPDKAEEMGTRMGRLLLDFHHTPANTGKLVSMLDAYKNRIHGMEKYLRQDEIDKLLAVYDRLEERTTMLHGDFHSKNIMYMDGELVFIDMGDAGYGHPLLDLGSSYLGMIHIGKTNPASVPQYIGLDFDTVMTMWDRMLTEYFGAEHVEEANRLAEIYGEAKYTLVPTFYTKMTEEMANNLVGRVRQNGFLSESFDISPALNRTITF
ncbi:MAG: phosphotransferase [Lachnospiraceae bacterium]|nr:phosphotransferase [Lachnospiraceae bacterium]